MRISPSRLTALVALPFVLVLVADVADTWLERRRGERNVLIGARAHFQPHDRVVRLAPLADGSPEDGITLGSGWTGPVRGGLGVTAGGATLRVALPNSGPTILLVEARQRGATGTGGQLRVKAGGVPLGGIGLTRTWTEVAFGLPAETARRGRVDVRFEPDRGVEAVVRRIAVTAERPKALDDLDRADGFEHDASGGRLTVARPGRVVVEIDAAPVPSRLVARVRFLPRNGQMPVGHARLSVSTGPGGGAEPAAAAELDATEALWRDLSLDVPQGEPVELVVAVPTLGDGDTFVLESVWRRPD